MLLKSGSDLRKMAFKQLHFFSRYLFEDPQILLQLDEEILCMQFSRCQCVDLIAWTLHTATAAIVSSKNSTRFPRLHPFTLCPCEDLQTICCGSLWRIVRTNGALPTCNVSCTKATHGRSYH